MVTDRDAPTRARPPRRRVRISVFVKLIAVMLMMTMILIVVVAGFIALIGSPNLQISERFFEQFAKLVARSEIDRAQATDLARRLEIDIRYDGPDGTWATAADVPTIDEVRRVHASRDADASDGVWLPHSGFSSWHNAPSTNGSATSTNGSAASTTGSRDSVSTNGSPDAVSEWHGWLRGLRGRDYYIISLSNGHRYVFSWYYRRQLVDAHTQMLWLILGSMTIVVLLAYGLLRRVLRPVRSLDEGVARLSDGQLDVVLPTRTRDEFGALTEAFNFMVGRVREMIRARDQLLLDVSHELRSPLTRLKVALELMPDDDQRARMAADVVEMEAMVAELLELERLRDGRGLRLARQDLVPLLEDVAASFRDRAPGVRVVTTTPTIPLDLDEHQVRIVFRNVLENAVKYSFADSRPIEIAAAEQNGAIVVRVIDDGPGIPPSDLANIFEPFFRVDRSRSKKTGGYGLGLSICKRIVEAHGGTIAVENNPGRGTSFVLTWPNPRDAA
jgi:signal transduction histidine kinase